MIKVFWFRFVMFRSLPAPLQYAARMAWYMQVKARNPRNRDRWLNQLERQWQRWRNRSSDSVLLSAQGLLAQGWQLCSDWPLVPRQSGQVFFGLKLAKGAHPYVDQRKLELVWDVDQDAHLVPVDRVYQMLGLPYKNTDEQLMAWETCFWLSFLTEESLGQAVERERLGKRR